jgi:hypothetical protein
MTNSDFAISQVYTSLRPVTEVLGTVEQTVPDAATDERSVENDQQQAVNYDGKKVVVNRGAIWSSLILLIAVMFLLHFMN